MSIQLASAARADLGQLRSMLDRYLRELAGYREEPVGAVDSAGYPYLEAYWSEPGRHPFLILSGGRVAGFALIRDPDSTGSATHQVAEFFIEPESRRLGIGRRAAAMIWQRFPGTWELQVHARNAAALRFWSSSAEAATGRAPQMRAIQAPDGGRIQFSFHVERVV